jgi:AGZA family xanthine/uracil permease-like MFS transporter
LEKFFKLKENGTNVKTEILAGITTFLAMAYIIIVNPSIITQAMGIINDLGLGEYDIDFYFTVILNATCIAAAIGTLIMAVYAKLPFAQAPGMGLNAFFAFTIMLGFGLSFQQGLAAVVFSGILFIIITIFGLREMIVKAIPSSIRHSITVGIGLFIAIIGLRDGGVIVSDQATGNALFNFGGATFAEMSPGLLTLIGLAITLVLVLLNVKGALLWGILITTLVGIPLQVTNLAGLQNAKWYPDLSYLSQYGERVFPDFAGLFEYSGATNGIISGLFGVIIIVISFSIVDLFDTIGTLIGTGARAGLLDKDGNLPNMKQALTADAVATTIGGFAGTSTVTTYIESGAGIIQGGKTGLTSLVTAGLFILALFFGPIIRIIPMSATAPILIIVGIMMMGAVKNIDFDDMEEAIPAFLTLAIMPFTYSIATGIAAGFIFYPIVKIAKGKAKEVHPIIYIFAVLFIIRYAVL